MKSLILYFGFILLLLASCSKKDNIHDNDSMLSDEDKNQIIEELSKVLAISLKDVNVRQFVFTEINKQFTLDYDITYEMIRDKTLVTEKYGTVCFNELIERVAQDNSIDITSFSQNCKSFRNLQISSPAFFEKWEPEAFIPEVISLPQEYDEGEEIAVKAYKADGSFRWILEQEVDEPFLLVRESERVDKDGMITVDIDGLVIPEGFRYMSAARAYEIACENGSGLKSAEVVSHEPLIVMVDDMISYQKMVSLETKDKKDSSYNPLQYKSTSDIGIPTSITAIPNTSKCIQVKWGGVTGAYNYELFRQYGTYDNTKIATLDASQNIYNDMNLENGIRYSYSARSVDSNGNVSGLTYPADAIASWRNNRTYEKIIKIYVSRDCWNSAICGLFDGKIELQYKLVLFNRENKSIESLPSGAIGSLPQRSSDDQKAKWCNYNQNLFLWDLQVYAYSYGIYFVEDDGTGSSVTVELSASLKVSLAESASGQVTASIKFTIAAKDDQIGSMAVHYDTENGYNFIITPIEKNPVGEFKVVFGQ